MSAYFVRNASPSSIHAEPVVPAPAEPVPATPVFAVPVPETPVPAEPVPAVPAPETLTPAEPFPAVPNDEVLQYFNNNGSLPNVDSPPSAHSNSFISDGLIFRILDGDEENVEVVGMAAATSAFSIIVPAITSVGEKRVKKIANSAFFNACRLKTISLPASVQTIDDRAFAGSGLVSISLSDSIKAVGKGAFAGCSQLASVALSNSMVRIEDRTFMNCAALKEVTLPTSLLELGDSAFENCFLLNELLLPEHVRSIGQRCFYNCKSMHTFRFSPMLEDIGNLAFGECTSLSSITTSSCEFIINNILFLKDTKLFKSEYAASDSVRCVLGTVFEVKELEYRYFQLPSDTEVIASYAFANNDTLQTIRLPSTIRMLHPNALVQRMRIKTVDDKGVVRCKEGFGIKLSVIYDGTVDQWQSVTKLRAAEGKTYPVVVTCRDDITFIDYI